LLPLSLLGLTAASRAEILYRLTPMPEAKRLRVEMTVPVVGQETVVQMPRWEPGWYMIRNYAENVRDIEARDRAGKVVGTVKVDDQTWRIPGGNGGTVLFSYTVPAEDDAGTWNVSGPSTYFYVAARKTEPCRLTLNLPAGWKNATGLNGDGPEYKAPDYDVLADNPLSLGTFHEVRYTVQGKPHLVVIGGRQRDAMDRARLVDWCRKVTEMESDFFGGLPYEKYVWHFRVGPGAGWAGGLEHLSSTQISLGQTLAPGSVSVLAHEFFHLWNVKRIRSKPLGPFDYTKLPRTGAFWWLEGVTDYYAWSLLRRYGHHDDEVFYAGVVDTLRGQRRNPARLEVSPYDSSFRVADANNGRGSASGYRVSYYDTGYLVGLCLDLELLHRTQGRHSLDDVTHALWQQTRGGKPGFEEGDIRRHLVAVGGPEMGTYYDEVVMKPGELPLEKAFAHVGLTLTGGDGQRPTLGFSAREEGGRIRVTAVTDRRSPLRVGDELIASSEDLAKIRRDLAVGQVLDLKVLREGKEVEIKHQVRTNPAGWTLEPAPDATPEQIRLREKWLSRKR
jgi:predicted metalloprotease with PDZ domain